MQVYLPMGYIYCQRFSHPADPLTSALREELYPAATRYQDIDWDGARHLVADIDNYTPIGAVMRTAHNMLAHYERAGGIRSLRRRGLAFGALCRRTCFARATDGCSAAIEYIHAEDEQTNYIDIGPVNKAMNMLCVWIAAGGAADGKAASSVPAFQSHLASKRQTHALMPKASTSADTPVHLRSARLPVGGRGRAENARVQWQPVLGHVLRAAGCLRSRLVWRAAANGGQGVALPGEDANFEYRRKLLDGGQRVRIGRAASALLPPREPRRLALLHLCARVANFRRAR